MCLGCMFFVYSTLEPIVVFKRALELKWVKLSYLKEKEIK